MAKQQKGNREAKKPKAASHKVKKQKKEQKGHNGGINELFGHSK